MTKRGVRLHHVGFGYNYMVTLLHHTLISSKNISFQHIQFNVKHNHTITVLYKP